MILEPWNTILTVSLIGLGFAYVLFVAFICVQIWRHRPDKPRKRKGVRR